MAMQDALRELSGTAQDAYKPLVPLLGTIKLLRAESDHSTVVGLIDAALEMRLPEDAKRELEGCRAELTSQQLKPPITPDTSADGFLRLSRRNCQFELLVEWLWAA